MRESRLKTFSVLLSLTLLLYSPPTNAQNPWYEELDLPGAFHLGYLRDLIVSLYDFPARVPDQSFILSETHEGEGESLISGLRSATGKWALVHSPFGELVKVKKSVLDGSKFSKAEWSDPRTGDRSVAKAENDEAESWSFVPPSSGSNNDDWTLVITA